MQLFRVLELAPSFFVRHFVLDMPMWLAHCTCCGRLSQITGDVPTLENVYCFSCWKWWYEMHAEVWWAATRAYVVMQRSGESKCCALVRKRHMAFTAVHGGRLHEGEFQTHVYAHVCICILRWEVAPIHAGGWSILLGNLRSTYVFLYAYSGGRLLLFRRV